jgi:glycosyltransferase involved in cell wall biosynthesis
MRLLVVSSWYPHPPDNGSRLRITHLLEALARDHVITLLSFGREDGSEQVEPLRRYCAAVHVVPQAAPGRLGTTGLLSMVPRYYAQTRSPDMLALISAQAPLHDAAMAMQIRAAYHLVEAHPRLPILFEEVEVGAAMSPDLTQPSSRWRRARHGLTWWKHQRFLRRLIDRSDRVTVVSAPERDHLIALGCDPARVAVVPNAVAVPDGPVEPRARLPQVIYPGAVTFSANLDAVRYFVRDVWPRIRKVRPDVGFVVTGETTGIDVGELASVEGVRFTGRLPEVDSLVARSLACVVPLRVGGGTRLKVLHAMALGTPVVSTSKGIEGLDVTPERHVLVGDTAESLAAQVLRVVGDPALAARLASDARARVRDAYTWEKSAAILAHELARLPVSPRGALTSPAAG